MASSNFFYEQRICGVLLILAFILFAIGATLPIVGEKGNSRIFNLPTREYLLAVTDNAIIWRWANIFMGSAAVILLAGLSIFTTILEGANERIFSRLGLTGFLLAGSLWIIFSAYRAVISVLAGQELAATGMVPTYYEPLAQWASVLFYISAVVGFLALAAYGGALLQVTFLATWAGWATLIFSLAMLILLVGMGDTLPAFHYMPPLLIGILLLL